MNKIRSRTNTCWLSIGKTSDEPKKRKLGPLRVLRNYRVSLVLVLTVFALVAGSQVLDSGWDQLLDNWYADYQSSLLRKEKIEQQFAQDGSHLKLKNYVVSMFDAEEAFEHVKTSYIDKKDHIFVIMTYQVISDRELFALEQIAAKVDEDGDILDLEKHTYKSAHTGFHE